VVVCTIYYLDPAPGGSWADFVLNKVRPVWRGALVRRWGG
jgi:hypothetical protein